MEIIDLEKLKEDIKALLDRNIYLVDMLQDKLPGKKNVCLRNMQQDKEVGIIISTIPSQEQIAQERYPPPYQDIIFSQEEIARVRYAPNYHDIIIEEVPPISKRKYIELSSTHRPRLQEMGRKLEEKINQQVFPEISLGTNQQVFPETTPGTSRTVIYIIGSFK